MKLIILGGFLGTGKTSILMPMAQEIVKAAGGGDKTRLAIIENEIGQVGIDTAFTQSAGFATTELFNGCVCCSLASSLMDTLCKLEEDVNPEWVILECTGLARPNDIAEALWENYDREMSITVCILVDVSRWMRLKNIAGELMGEQVSKANYILLNKIDLAEREEIDAVKADIAAVSEANIIEMSAKNDAEGTMKICDDIIEEILSWEK